MAYAEKTDVPFDRSISEIIGMLRRAGAERIVQSEDRNEFKLMFFMNDRFVRFRIVWPTIEEVSQVSGRREATEEEKRGRVHQAMKQRGRALYLVVKAKLESVESNVETFEEAFLANVVMANGETVIERITGNIADEYETGTVRPLLTFHGGGEA